MAHTHVAPATATWWKRENLVLGLALLVLTAIAWAYTLSQAGAMRGMPMPSATSTMGGMQMSPGMDDSSGMDSMEMPSPMAQPGGFTLFLFGWAVMMVAMMFPSALPLILLYRTIARKRLGLTRAAIATGALLVGYVAVWTVAGLPVYGYSLLSTTAGPMTAILPGLLLIAGGVYQFTPLKQSCHTRCSNPLFFVTHKWRPGVTGASRLGVLHGIDCLGCCLGLMVALVALGMMNIAWMLTAAIIIFVEKTLPRGHSIARPLGVALVMGGLIVLGLALRNGMLTM